MARKNTDKLLGMIEDGLWESETVLMACLKYMSEQDVTDMAESNDFFVFEDEV